MSRSWVQDIDHRQSSTTILVHQPMRTKIQRPENKLYPLRDNFPGYYKDELLDKMEMGMTFET